MMKPQPFLPLSLSFPAAACCVRWTLTPAPSLVQLMEELDEKKQAIVDSFVAQFGLDLQHIRKVLEKSKVCVSGPFPCCRLRPYFQTTFQADDFSFAVE